MNLWNITFNLPRSQLILFCDVLVRLLGLYVIIELNANTKGTIISWSFTGMCFTLSILLIKKLYGSNFFPQEHILHYFLLWKYIFCIDVVFQLDNNSDENFLSMCMDGEKYTKNSSILP